MNSNPHNTLPANSNSAEETLRLIATLPAPSGLEDRVHAALHAAPRTGHVLLWPSALRPGTGMGSGWMRAAAAAAIAFVVVGGGWGVYSRVQQGPPDKVIVMPSSGGFGSSGAIRTPKTIPGPTVVVPVKAHPTPPKGTKKPNTSAVRTAANPQTAPVADPVAAIPVVDPASK